MLDGTACPAVRWVRRGTINFKDKTMRKIKAIVFAAALAMPAMAFAQTDTVTVNLAGISADVAAELGVKTNKVPGTVDLSAALAAEACGLDATTITGSCDAVISTVSLIDAIEDQDGNASEHSARQFAPGHQDGPARAFAPGQQDGNASDSAPGQVKKTD